MEQDIVGNSNAKRSSFEVAIVGGGIVGLCIAKGLVARHIPVTVYEQALEFHEIGAGIGFARNIMECLRALDAQLYDILARMSIQGQGVRWVDGTRREDIRQRPVDQLADSEMQEDYLLTNSFLRAQVANAVAGLIPDHCLKLGKRLVKLEQTNAEKVYLEFHDGEKAVVDAGMWLIPEDDV
jgi:salicylate hydroxylase